MAKCGSFSKAAKSLYMTQPAISQAIMQLEDELEIRLFTRTPRGVVLTKEGEILHEYASSGINLIDTGKKRSWKLKILWQGGAKNRSWGDTISRYFFYYLFFGRIS